MPRPRPNGMITPITELRSRARMPSTPSSTRRDERADEGARDDARAEQQRARRAGERQLADPVHGERQVAGHHDDADDAAEQAEHRTGDQRVADQRQQLAVVAEVDDVVPVHDPTAEVALTAAAPSVRGGLVVVVVVRRAPSSDAPSTTSRSPRRITSMSAPYSSDSTSDVITSSGVPSRNRPSMM